MSNRFDTGLIGFVNKNKITLVLIVILFSLIKQNTLLQSQISNFTEKDSSLIESKARFKYGLIKEGEYFFKIKKIIETDNSAENSESAL